jgi:methyl-accepting chemotaxis protein
MLFGRERRRSAELKSDALDAVSAGIMIVDAELKIVSVNEALMSLLRSAETDIKTELAGFSAANVVGRSFDTFHKNPPHLRQLLRGLTGPHRETLKIGGRLFDLVMTRLHAVSGSAGGFAIEWCDAAVRLQNLALAAQVAAANRSQAVIEFGMDGTIVTANENFLAAMGYQLDDIRGRHHRMFVDPQEAESAAYSDFWAALRRGEYKAGEFKRIGKSQREVWILASYNPVLDEDDKPVKVVKFASDVTNEKLRRADHAGQITAIGKSQAVIEFAMDGTIQSANENFLVAMGYSLGQIKGRHHSMFVDPGERDSAAYREFWISLGRGEYKSGEFKRVASGGRDVWIQASYNPILDLNGRPFKVVKYASDVTAQVIARMKSEHVRSMMESVAAGAEELSASVREISATMGKSKEATVSTIGQVEAADQKAQRLSDAASAMSGIVQMIGEITGQINLLALNATIESARAGEAGRGFAVVASEVKNLANQAKQATDKIAAEIESLNGISADVATSLTSIKSLIQSVGEYVTSTAAAIEEQSTVTEEMSTGMQKAAAEAASIGG